MSIMNAHVSRYYLERFKSSYKANARRNKFYVIQDGKRLPRTDLIFKD